MPGLVPKMHSPLIWGVCLYLTVLKLYDCVTSDEKSRGKLRSLRKLSYARLGCNKQTVRQLEKLYSQDRHWASSRKSDSFDFLSLRKRGWLPHDNPPKWGQLPRAFRNFAKRGCNQSHRIDARHVPFGNPAVQLRPGHVHIKITAAFFSQPDNPPRAGRADDFGLLKRRQVNRRVF